MFVAFLAAAAAVLPKPTPIDVGSWFTTDDYPAEAAKKGVEGDVSFDVDVDVEGKPTACRITKSSGSPILDQTTCDIVLKRAKFKPATLKGKAVASHYSKRTSWRLDGIAVAENAYVATIVDFSTDPDHPSCTIVTSGRSAPAPCDNTVKKYASEGAADKLVKLVMLSSFTTGDGQPYRGDPAWGRRVAFVALDLYAPQDGGKKACSVVAEEGAPPDGDPCEAYGGAHALSEDAKKSAKKSHIEQSLFAVLRAAPNDRKCKQGESSAEVHGCG